MIPLLLALLAPAREAPWATVPDFSLRERSGRKVTRADLEGKVWVASFVLTRCPDGRCPQVTTTVKRLHDELASRKDLLFVTFTVDPKEDGTKELAKYADSFGADPDRWLFLTGEEKEIEGVLKAFHLPVGKNEKGTPAHAQKLFLVDKAGGVIAYTDGLWERKAVDEEYFEGGLKRLKREIDKELKPANRPYPAWMPRDFPAFNAMLNALATVLLLVGYWAIRFRLVRLHIACMLTTLLVSAVFLASYLFFHIYVKDWRATRFVEQAPDAPAWVAIAYAAILLSHTILAIVATPMALATAYFGLRGWWKAHIKLARWTFPIWVYVSTTGVVVYWMLYRMYPAP